MTEAARRQARARACTELPCRRRVGEPVREGVLARAPARGELPIRRALRRVGALASLARATRQQLHRAQLTLVRGRLEGRPPIVILGVHVDAGGPEEDFDATVAAPAGRSLERRRVWSVLANLGSVSARHE